MTRVQINKGINLHPLDEFGITSGLEIPIIDITFGVKIESCGL